MTFDWTILYYIQDQLTSPLGDWIMPKITHLGDAGLIWIGFGLGLVLTKKYRTHGFVMLAALGIGVLIGNLALKNIVARPRPCWIDSSIPLLIQIPTDYSFPSGHTLASVIGATCVYLTNKKLAWVAISLAILIAFSRLYLFVHFPTDVIASAILGITIGKLSMSHLYEPLDNLYHKYKYTLKKTNRR